MTPSKVQIAKAQLEALQRELSRRRLMPFIKRFNPKYQAGWVHDDICRRLERFSKAVAEEKSPRLMILMPPRHGKQVSDCTPVLTTTGWKKHGDLRPGDKVFHPSGAPVVVLAVAEPLTQDCEVEFTDGAKVLVHENHEWMVYDRSRSRYRVVETKYLERRKLWNGPVGARGGRATFLLPRTHALVMPDAELPVAPYVLGAWLGDGKSSSGQICWSANDDVVAQAINAHYPFTSRWTHQTTRVEYAALPITPELRALGLLNNKHIPEQYLLSSIDQRLELLAGLIDTDGHVEPDTQRVRVATVSDRLAKDIEILVRSLGWRANRYTQAPATSTSGIVGRQPVHYVSFTPDGPIPTRIPRKRIVGGSTQGSIGIVAVRRVAQTTGRCIQVDSPDGLYLVGEYLTPTHNSEIASRNFPAWHLGQYPDHEFIACSYNLSLAMDFSRKVKGIMSDPLYAPVFETRLDPNNQSTESWGIAGHRGGYVAAGIGGPITGKGAHCLPGSTLVSTSSGHLTLEALYLLKSLPEIITPLGPRRALAITKRPAPQLYELRFSSGGVLRATGNHPIYLPDRAMYATVESLYGEAQGSGGLDLRVVREVVSATTMRSQQVSEAGLDGVLLQPSVQPGASRRQEREVVQNMRKAGRGDQEEPERGVLLGRMRTESSAPLAQDLPAVLRGISAEAFKTGLLRGGLRKYGAHDPYAWEDELELADGQRIRVLVRPDEVADPDQGSRVCDMQHGQRAVLPPHRRGPEQQPARESSDTVPDAPHGAPQVCYDTLSMVGRVGGSENFVYDLQVEDAGCFFADSVLVGNCLVIDDPVKNAEEADSADTREKIWEWYLSTAYSRLSPGGGVLIIQTWWHDDDLAGRIQNLMKNADDDYIDQFEVVKYPAIAEADEWLNESTGLIEYDPPQELLAQPDAQYTLLRKKGEALHPDRYDLEKLLRIKAQNNGGRWWAALYQQNPVPDDGGYFTKDQFRRAPPPSLKLSNVFIAWDFAISEKKQNDYTVGTVLLQDYDDVLHVVDQVRFKSGDAFFIVEAILNLAHKWHNPSLVIGFEDGQIYRAIESLLKKRMRERQFYPPTMVLKPITDKLARARALQGRMQQGMISFSASGDWYDGLRTEMLRFPAGAHDDQVDSLSWAVQMVVGREPPKKPAEQKTKSWKDKLRTDGVLSHMVA